MQNGRSGEGDHNACAGRETRLRKRRGICSGSVVVKTMGRQDARLGLALVWACLLVLYNSYVLYFETHPSIISRSLSMLSESLSSRQTVELLNSLSNPLGVAWLFH